MKTFIQEIKENKNLEMNLPQYANYLMDLYHKRSTVELTMDYYTFSEMMQDHLEQDTENNKELIELAKCFKNILDEDVLKIQVDEAREKAIKKIDDLRNIVYKKVDVLAAYADIFTRYEYVSNRCEYLFKPEEVNEKYTDEDFTREIMQYIFSDEENAVINEKICEIIAELPLRMTKGKFFELLDQGLSVYSKTDQQTIDDFIYMLKSSSMLQLPEELESIDVLNTIYNEVTKMDFNSITEEQFVNLENVLRFAADFIEKQTNLYTMLEGMINKAYVILIAVPYVSFDEKEIECCRKIITAINQNYINGNYKTLSDDITDQFVFLEGIPEELNQKIQSVEFILDQVKNDNLGIVKSIMADNIYLGLFICENLLSDSLFIDLTDIKNIFNKNETTAEEEIDILKYLHEQRNELVKSLKEFFETHQKQVNRSVMALIISRIPVFFNNITEVQDYVYNALSNCTNKAEKIAAIEIVKCIINEN